MRPPSSVAPGVAIVALTTRFHPTYHGGTSNGPSWTVGLIIIVVVFVLFFGVGRFVRRRKD